MDRSISTEPSPIRDIGETDEPRSSLSSSHAIVAVIIEWRDQIALLRRSRGVAHDEGLWHCVTGYLESGTTPAEQAFRELEEEAGLQQHEIKDLKAGPRLALDDPSGNTWLVHTFTAVTSQRRLRINWESDAYRWTHPKRTPRFGNRVKWLDCVLLATGHISR